MLLSCVSQFGTANQDPMFKSEAAVVIQMPPHGYPASQRDKPPDVRQGLASGAPLSGGTARTVKIRDEGLSITKRTADTHVKSAIDKLKARNRS
jgi:hypothetical protein